MRIVYIGIDFLSATLDSLLLENCEVMEIYTCQTDNKTEFNTYVTDMAKKLKVPCHLERITRKDLERLKKQGLEAVFCAGYYYKIPILEDLPMINVHPALLPVGRGAWPMPITILRGLRESGVTLHKLSDKLDSGDILLKEAFCVDPNENLISFMDKVNLSITHLIKKLMKSFDGIYQNATPQGEGEYFPMPTKKDYTITSDMTDTEIDKVLRAFYGYECIWQENGTSVELIGGRLVCEYPSKGRVFVTRNNHYIVADKITDITKNQRHPDCVGIPDLQYRKKVEQIRQKYGHELSSHAFASLYLWRRAMCLTLYIGKDMYTVRCGYKGNNAWFFPCGDEREIIEFIHCHRNETDFSFCYMRKEDMEFLNRYFPDEFEINRTESSDEYIYERKGHQELTGKLYANVRTQLHKAKREHIFQIETLSKDNVSIAGKILEEWEKKDNPLAKVNMTQKGFLVKNDREEREALQNMQKLGMTGILVFVDGIPYAVAAGYPISKDTYDLFLAKEKSHLAGVGYFVKREFFLSLPKQYQYLNIEEDLGEEGLREMKKRLVPIRMNEIWEANWCKKERTK